MSLNRSIKRLTKDFALVTSEENDALKPFNGKAIYQPQGAAGEYAKYACNFFKGCSNSCSYCFNKRWNWGNVPKLKACFKDEKHALEVFEKELRAILPELQKHGLLFRRLRRYTTNVITSVLSCRKSTAK